MTDVILVLVTAPSTDKAAELARTLVEEQLAACGNIVPGVRSIFRWDGAVQREAEVLIVLKTVAARIPAVLDRVPELHPYAVPEVLVVPIEAGHGAYLDWVRRESAGAEAR